MSRQISIEECDTSEEVCKVMQELFDNQALIEEKVCQLASGVEIMSKVKKKTGKEKVAAVVGMIVFAVIFLFVGSTQGYVATDINSEIAANHDLLAEYLRDSFANITSNSFLFTPTDTAPPATEGMVYYNDTANNLKLRTDTAWVDIDVSGASSLDAAYGIGAGITVDAGAVTLTAGSGDDNIVLALVQGDTDASVAALAITSAGDAAALTFAQSGSGGDLQGTSSTWTVSAAGAFTGESFTGATHSQGIIFDTNAEIQFGDASEDVAMVFTSDTVTWATDSSVDQMAFGVVDNLTGINAIVFDAAVANTITQTGTGNDDDLTISQAGTVDCSLILQSAGSITDALSLITTDAVGVIKISSSDILDIDTVDDITIDTSDGTYTLTIGGASDGKYIMTAADTSSAISVDDFHIGSTAGTITIEAEEDTADALFLTADGGTSSTVKIFNDTGTAVDSIEILSDEGGITLEVGSNDAITYNGAATSLIIIEGTANGFETTLSFTDPTADGTISFPDTADEGAAGGDLAWVADAGSVSQSGAVTFAVTDSVILWTTSGSDAGSLPDGEEGQILSVVIVSDGGEGTITPDTCSGCGWATVVLSSDIDQVSFLYVDDTIGWIILGTSSDGTNIVEVTQ